MGWEEETLEGSTVLAAIEAASGLAVAARGPVKKGWAASVGDPPARTVHRPFLRLACSKRSNWEQKMNCFFIDLTEVLLWAGLRLSFLFDPT